MTLTDNQSGVLSKSSRESSFLIATDYITQTLTNIAGVISMSILTTAAVPPRRRLPPKQEAGRDGRVPAVTKVAKVTSTPSIPLESNRFFRATDSVNSAFANRGGHLLSALSVTSFQSCAYLASVYACRKGV